MSETSTSTVGLETMKTIEPLSQVPKDRVIIESSERDCNAKYYCQFRWCLTGCMVYFVLALIGWSYFVLVCWVAIPYWKTSPCSTIAILVVWHILLSFQLVSYLRCICTDPGTIPSNIAELLATTEKKHNGQQRFCDKCNNVKPDRAHHCRICKRCVLKMDHHCPWVNNCVGFRNYKFFLLFLFWTCVVCLFVVCSFLPTILTLKFENMGGQQIQVLLVFFVACAFGFGLFFFHISTCTTGVKE